MIDFVKLKFLKTRNLKQEEALSPYNTILKSIIPKANSETQELTFNTFHALLAGGSEKKNIIRLYSSNAELYDKRAYLCISKLLLNHGKTHGYLPVPKKYHPEGKMPFGEFCSYTRPDLCPKISTIAKMIGELRKS